MPRSSLFFALAILVLFASACQAQPQMEPTQTIAPPATQTPAGLPRTEAEVSRVTVEEAKAALASGTALIVDVRRAEAFEASHIAGAINIPLAEIETNPTGLNLDKDQWIITYCT